MMLSESCIVYNAWWTVNFDGLWKNISKKRRWNPVSATIMTFYNEKGGVGKTSTTAFVGYNLSKLGYKVLIIDFDPQSNATQLLLKTASQDGEIITLKQSLMSAIKQQVPLNDIRLKVRENLYLIPTARDFSLYQRWLDHRFNKEAGKVMSFASMITSDMRDEYDFIFIDVSPTFSLTNDAAFFACDQMVIMLQTQERSLKGAEETIAYLQHNLIDEFGARIQILGILPVLEKHQAKVDAEILQIAADEFDADNIFSNRITIMERVKRMDMTGITDRDGWDRRTHTAYRNVALEIIDRLGMELREQGE